VKLEGVYLPVTTPFDPTRGGIDLDGFGQNLRAWGEHRVAGYVIAGSTGEAPLLDEPELLERGGGGLVVLVTPCVKPGRLPTRPAAVS